MKEILNWRINLQVQGGPSIGDAQKLEVDAYEKLDFEVPAKTTTGNGSIEVGLQLEDTSRVSLVIIKCSSYKGIVAKVQPTAQAPQPKPALISISIDGPLMLIGKGACQLLGNNLQSLTLTNSENSPTEVNMLIGRDVH